MLVSNIQDREFDLEVRLTSNIIDNEIFAILCNYDIDAISQMGMLIVDCILLYIKLIYFPIQFFSIINLLHIFLINIYAISNLLFKALT